MVSETEEQNEKPGNEQFSYTESPATVLGLEFELWNVDDEMCARLPPM